MMLARYTVTGAAATGLHYLVLALLVEFGGWPAPLAAGAGSIAGMLFAYAVNRRYTFRSRGPHSRTLLRFVAIALAGAALNGALVAMAVDRLSMHYLLAQCAATLVVLALTFPLNRRWTFA
jgi:putative flippase GtrA